MDHSLIYWESICVGSVWGVFGEGGMCEYVCEYINILYTLPHTWEWLLCKLCMVANCKNHTFGGT